MTMNLEQELKHAVIADENFLRERHASELEKFGITMTEADGGGKGRFTLSNPHDPRHGSSNSSSLPPRLDVLNYYFQEKGYETEIEERSHDNGYTRRLTVTPTSSVAKSNAPQVLSDALRETLPDAPNRRNLIQECLAHERKAQAPISR